ncbi:MAG: hypothetical protein R3A52_32965 [Polyangiales bacterium]
MEAIAHLHTKASSPPMADGAALVFVGDAAAAERTGMRPRARVCRRRPARWTRW